MSGKTAIFLVLMVLAFLVAAAAHFLPQMGIPVDTGDFFGGLGAGFLIAVIFGWIADKKS
jgi:hypothetical protein